MSTLPPPPPGLPPPPRKKVPPPGEKGEVILLDGPPATTTTTTATTSTTTTAPVSQRQPHQPLIETPQPAPSSTNGGGADSGKPGVLAQLEASKPPTPPASKPEAKKEESAATPAPKPSAKVSPFGGGAGGMAGVLAELQAKKAPTPPVTIEVKKEVPAVATTSSSPTAAPTTTTTATPTPTTTATTTVATVAAAPKPAAKTSPFGGGGMTGVLAELQAKRAPIPAVSVEKKVVVAAAAAAPAPQPKPAASAGGGGMAGVLAELQAKRAPIPAVSEFKKEAPAVAPGPKLAAKVSPFGAAAAGGGGGGMSGVLAELQAKRAPTPAVSETKKEALTPVASSSRGGGMSGVLAELQAKRPPVESAPSKSIPSSTTATTTMTTTPRTTVAPGPILKNDPVPEPEKRAPIPPGTERSHPLSDEPPKKAPQPVSEEAETKLVPVPNEKVRESRGGNALAVLPQVQPQPQPQQEQQRQQQQQQQQQKTQTPAASSPYHLPPPTTSSAPLSSAHSTSAKQLVSAVNASGSTAFESDELNHHQISVGPVLTELNQLRKLQQEQQFQQGNISVVASSPPLLNINNNNNNNSPPFGIRPLGQRSSSTPFAQQQLQQQQQQQQQNLDSSPGNSASLQHYNNNNQQQQYSTSSTPPRGPLRTRTPRNTDAASVNFAAELANPNTFTAADGLPMSLHAALSPQEVDKLHQLLEQAEIDDQNQQHQQQFRPSVGSPYSPPASEARRRILDLIGELHRLDESSARKSRPAFDATPQTQLSQTELAIELNRVSDSFFGWLRRATMYSQGELHRHCEDAYAAAAGAISASCQPSSDVVLDANQRSAMRQILTSWRLMWVRARGEDEAALEQRIRELQSRWFAVQNSEVAEHLHLGQVYLDQLRLLVSDAAALLPNPSRDPAAAAVTCQLAWHRRDVLLKMEQDAAPRLRLDANVLSSPSMSPSNRSSAAASWIRLHSGTSQNELSPLGHHDGGGAASASSPVASPFANRTSYRGNERRDLIGVSGTAMSTSAPYTSSLNEALAFRRGLERALGNNAGNSSLMRTNNELAFSPVARPEPSAASTMIRPWR